MNENQIRYFTNLAAKVRWLENRQIQIVNFMDKMYDVLDRHWAGNINETEFEWSRGYYHDDALEELEAIFNTETDGETEPDEEIF